MWQFLSKIDPNVAIMIVSTLGGWVWNKLRGEKTKSFAATITGVIDAIVLEQFGELDDASAARVNIQGYVRAARDRAERHAWTVLAKRGVPRNKVTERLVHEAIERAGAELVRELAERQAEARRRASDPRVTVNR